MRSAFSLFLFGFFVSFSFLSCSHQHSCQTHVVEERPSMDHMILSTIWFQKSGEVKALQYQAFNLAKSRLDQALKRRHKKPYAIVVDVDETVLDNSPFQGRNILKKESYPVGWSEWVAKAQAKPIAGALEFLNYAQNQKRVDVFYVTNRKSDGFDATYTNLLEAGFPVNKDRILVRTAESSKEVRRSQILETHDILLLIGDNLGDFASFFEFDDYSQRNLAVDKNKTMFGDKFIVLPNPMYGDWERVLAPDYFKKSIPKRVEIQKELLEGFEL